MPDPSKLECFRRRRSCEDLGGRRLDDRSTLTVLPCTRVTVAASADLQGDNAPAAIDQFDPCGDGPDTAPAGVGGEHLARTSPSTMRTRTRRSVAAAVWRHARQRDDGVDERGRHQRAQLRDGPAPVDDLENPTQRRIGERRPPRAAAAGRGASGAAPGGEVAGCGGAARPVRAAGTRSMPTGGGS